MNVYVIEHHDIYEIPEQLCIFVGTRKAARAKASRLRGSNGVVMERYVRSAQDKDTAEHEGYLS
jgi:hypothetical protein